jgi:hypothetical protein
MKKITTALCIVLFALVSCTKNDTPPVTENPTGLILPKKLIIKQDSEIRILNITYDGNKIVEAKNEIEKTVFTYTGDLVTREISYKNNAVFEDRKYVYENNKLKTEIIKGINTSPFTGNPIVTTYEYTQNSNGTITREIYDTDTVTGVVTKLGNIYTLTVENGNLVKDISTSEFGDVLEIFTTTFIYDNKNNPYKNILGFDKLNYTRDFHRTTNNLLKETRVFTFKYNSPNAIIRPAISDINTTYDFKYDANGYPMEEKKNFIDRNGVPKTNTTEYSY